MKMQQFKSRLGGQSLCVDDLKEAETAIIRFSQQEKFHSEIEALTPQLHIWVRSEKEKHTLQVGSYFVGWVDQSWRVFE